MKYYEKKVDKYYFVSNCCLLYCFMHIFFYWAVFYITETIKYDGVFTVAVKTAIRNNFILGFTALLPFILSCFLLFKINLSFEKHPEKKQIKTQRKAARKANRIVALEKHLNELKKDGE